MTMTDAQGIPSPVTGGATEVVGQVDAGRIERLYQEAFGIDVSRIFAGGPEPRLMRCLDTGYVFFHPHALAGDAEFYAELYSRKASETWAYKRVRWEFETARRLLEAEPATVLDVGAGSGAFLGHVRDVARSVRGLETSPYGVEEATRAGLDVRDETIERHVETYREAYEMVTAFQVLEHVPDVAGFMRACVKALAPGGRLLVAVPDDGGFIGLQEDLPLNLPPHHVGRWRRESLTALAPVFGLELQGIEREPLQEDNLAWYQAWMEERYLPPSRLVRALYYRLGGPRHLARYLAENRTSISGHTILAVWRRP